MNWNSVPVDDPPSAKVREIFNELAKTIIACEGTDSEKIAGTVTLLCALYGNSTESIEDIRKEMPILEDRMIDVILAYRSSEQ